MKEQDSQRTGELSSSEHFMNVSAVNNQTKAQELKLKISRNKGLLDGFSRDIEDAHEQLNNAKKIMEERLAQLKPLYDLASSDIVQKVMTICQKNDQNISIFAIKKAVLYTKNTNDTEAYKWLMSNLETIEDPIDPTLVKSLLYRK